MLSGLKRPVPAGTMGYQWSLTLHNIPTCRVVWKRGTGWYQSLEGARWVLAIWEISLFSLLVLVVAIWENILWEFFSYFVGEHFGETFCGRTLMLPIRLFRRLITRAE